MRGPRTPPSQQTALLLGASLCVIELQPGLRKSNRPRVQADVMKVIPTHDVGACGNDLIFQVWPFPIYRFSNQDTGIVGDGNP